ncbi:MAG: hypothetical protein LUM44_18200 [Pyrinomonadaceae bacterium]|nr:hypothetical protein [Pyrinomonadaceae bacterium]
MRKIYFEPKILVKSILFVCFGFLFSLISVQAMNSAFESQPGRDCPPEYARKPKGCSEYRRKMILFGIVEMKKLDRQILREPKNVALYLKRAEIYTMMYYRYGDVYKFEGYTYYRDISEKAISDLNKAIELAPGVDVYIRRGEIYRKRWEESIKDFIYPFDYVPTFEQIEKFYIENENFLAAEGDFLKAQDFVPDPKSSMTAFDYLANLYSRRASDLSQKKGWAKSVASNNLKEIVYKDFDWMIDYHTRLWERGKVAYKEDSFATWTYFEKAKAAANFGDDEIALTSSGKAAGLVKSDSFGFCSIYKLRGDLKAKAKDFDGAIQEYTFALDAKPESCKELYISRGDAKLANGEPQNAIADYSLRIKDDCEYICKAVYLKRGKLFIESGEYEKAVDDFTKAIGYSTLCEKDYQWRAKAYRLVGNEAAAKADEAKASEVLQKQKGYMPSDYCSNHN